MARFYASVTACAQRQVVIIKESCRRASCLVRLSASRSTLSEDIPRELQLLLLKVDRLAHPRQVFKMGVLKGILRLNGNVAWCDFTRERTELTVLL